MKETREELVVRAHDAEIEAVEWKETARRWRKRALQQGKSWRRKAKEFESLLAEQEEREQELRAEVAEAKRESKTRLTAKESDELKARVVSAEADALNTRYYKDRYHQLESQAMNQVAAVNKKLEMEKGKHAHAREEAQRAVAALRVVAVRLGVHISQDPHKLAGDIDSAVLALQNKANQ